MVQAWIREYFTGDGGADVLKIYLGRGLREPMYGDFNKSKYILHKKVGE